MSFKLELLSDDQLEKLSKKIRPVIEKDGELWYIKVPDLKKVAFTWDPKIEKKAEFLVAVRTVKTFHRFGAPVFFKPSIAEVFSSVDDFRQNDNRGIIAFKTEGPDTADNLNEEKAMLNAGYHVAKTTLYRSLFDRTLY